jgi:hypothetical protein
MSPARRIEEMEPEPRMFAYSSGRKKMVGWPLRRMSPLLPW